MVVCGHHTVVPPCDATSFITTITTVTTVTIPTSIASTASTSSNSTSTTAVPGRDGETARQRLPQTRAASAQLAAVQQCISPLAHPHAPCSFVHPFSLSLALCVCARVRTMAVSSPAPTLAHALACLLCALAASYHPLYAPSTHDTARAPAAWGEPGAAAAIRNNTTAARVQAAWRVTWCVAQGVAQSNMASTIINWRLPH